MKKILDLQLFSGGHAVSVVADGGFSAASASSSSDVAKDATVTLTLTPASTYELKSVEVLKGGVTLEVSEQGAYSFTMGESDVVIVVKSRKTGEYVIVENCNVYINGAKTELRKSLKLITGPNGAIIGVDAEGKELTIPADVVAELVRAGTLVKG